MMIPMSERAESSLRQLQDEVRQFAVERDWVKFHDPKSLILALVGEVGELAELFQWIPADQAASEFGDGDRQERAAEEISDVLIYLLGLGNALDVLTGEVDCGSHSSRTGLAFAGGSPTS